MTDRHTPGCLAAPLVLVVLAAIAGGCGASALDVARTTTLATGEAVLVAQQSAPEAVQVVEQRIRAAHPDDPAARVAALDAAAPTLLAIGRAVDAAAVAWRGLLAALRVWEATDEGDAWTAALACVVGAVVAAVDAFQRAGVDVPGELGAAVQLAAGFAGTCRGTGTP